MSDTNHYGLTNRESMPFYVGGGEFHMLANQEGFGRGCSTSAGSVHHDCGDEEIFAEFGDTPASYNEIQEECEEAMQVATQCAFEARYEEWRAEAIEDSKKMAELSPKVAELKEWIERGCGEASEEEIEEAREKLDDLEDKLSDAEYDHDMWLMDHPEPSFESTELGIDTRVEIIEKALMKKLEESHSEWLEAEAGEEEDV